MNEHSDVTVRNVAITPIDPHAMAMIALEGPPGSIMAVASDTALQSRLKDDLDVDELRFVEWSSDQVGFVTNVFRPIPVLKVLIEIDQDTQAKLFRVLVAEDHLEDALGNDWGIVPCLAAMLTDCDIEVVIRENL
ncbi:MAG: hypothetical protein K8R36_14525 [Planctomycetales bacterium]|nr:hypothetical protein [Planctomycetales bacterium]